MIRLHSPWPLFGDDLDLARSWLRPQLMGLVSLRTGHQAISLGLGDVLLEAVQSGAVKAESNALRQWRFRVARQHGEDNSYRHLLPEGLFEQTLTSVAYNIRVGRAIGVRMNGGIGDHLEALSLLLPWAKEQNCYLNLQMSAERQQQIKPLLRHWDGIHWQKKHEQRPASISVMALRAAAVGIAKFSKYHSWLPTKQTSQQSDRHLLCCWRAEGSGDRLSAHSRSVPWALVRKFYSHLLLLNPKTQIVDITNWKKWEATRFKAMGVEVVEPHKENLVGLADRCRTSRVVTIDTALVHLCAAAGQRADLLLNYFPDERWNELHRPEHNYGQLIKIWPSSQFGSWSAVMDSLTGSLADKG